MFLQGSFVEAIDNGVIKSDVAVSEDLRQQLCKAVKQLEEIPDCDNDWHPGSEEQVLDLVHPSLYPLVYGQSRIIPEGVKNLEESFKSCGHGTTLSVPSEETVCNPHRKEGGYYGNRGWNKKLWSRKFQWLPSECWCPAYSQNVE